MNTNELITEFSLKYPIESGESFGHHRSMEIITKKLPREIQRFCNLADEYFKIYGSVGTGNWAEIPWVAILDKDITTSTKNGYYVCLLFDREIKNVYLCLSLGWTQFEEKYGVKDGRHQINAVCRHYGKLLSADTGNFHSGNISLNATHDLGKGYEAGIILSRKYLISSLANEDIVKDIEELLEKYRQLKDIVGDSVLNVEIDAEDYDADYQTFKKVIAQATFQPISDQVIEKLIEKSKDYPKEVSERLVRQIPRNRKFAEYIKQKASYICSICGKEPFIQKNGQPYAEADHVTPLGHKGDDHPKNMRCLCAQCHAIITYGSDSEIKKLLS